MSIPATDKQNLYSPSIITQIIHAMQGQHSKVPHPSFFYSLLHGQRDGMGWVGNFGAFLLCKCCISAVGFVRSAKLISTCQGIKHGPPFQRSFQYKSRHNALNHPSKLGRNTDPGKHSCLWLQISAYSPVPIYCITKVIKEKE
jgi:hypothetical protein